ncbi:Bug family tripartite tricarboxylate transporter substrate binding protein [Modicisalibacter coralii]|uniref:Bug family tripartite tricarboxylate transporter substrate binding protein n=1 Tax=Modicisalibacter coralii TaxID=2304602 RepID=UPI00100B85BC|nr:tripartite tricarboxylate transporter substrate binding protein [Halomonas coralii]
MPLINARLTLAIVALSASGVLQAADYPQKNVNYVVPFASGGAVDVTGRLIADNAPEAFDGHKFVVKNMPGGGAVIGQTYVSSAPADGYTLLAMTSSIINNSLTKPVSYSVDSFTPLALYNLDPEVIVTAADSELSDLKHFLDAAADGGVSVATPGNGTSHHIAALALAQQEGLEFRFVHNASAAMQLQQLMGGHVQVSFMSLGEAVGPAQDGNITILAVMDGQRSDLAPDVPTYQEATGDDFQWGTFRGIAAPAGLPDDVEAELESRLQQVLTSPTFVERMNDAGYKVDYRDGEAFSRYLDTTAQKMQKVLPMLDTQS